MSRRTGSGRAATSVHALGIGVAHQPDDGLAAAAQPGLEAAPIGVRIGELGARDLGQQDTVPRLGDP